MEVSVTAKIWDFENLGFHKNMASDENNNNNNKVNVKALDERTLEWAKFKARTKRHWEKRSPIAFQTSLVILNDTWKMALVGAITGSIFPFGELYARPWGKVPCSHLAMPNPSPPCTETPGFGKYLVESSMRSKSALNCAVRPLNLLSLCCLCCCHALLVAVSADGIGMPSRPAYPPNLSLLVTAHSY